MTNRDNVKHFGKLLTSTLGDAVYTGMRHRDFDDVRLILWPDEDGWLLINAMDRPTKPASAVLSRWGR